MGDNYTSKCVLCDEHILFDKNQPSSGVDFTRDGKYYSACSDCVSSYVYDRGKNGDDPPDYDISDTDIENWIVLSDEENKTYLRSL